MSSQAVPPQLLGRTAHRIQLHNGVHIGVPPHARVEKAVLHEKTPLAKPQGRRCADEMLVTPVGIWVLFKSENCEKLIPWSNIYELDLLPETIEAKASSGVKVGK